MFENFEKPGNIQEKNKDEWKYVFPAETTELPYAFLRTTDATPQGKAIYSTIHFNGETFGTPEDKSEVSISEFVDFLRAKLGVEKIILSCCYPDRAKKIIGSIPNLEILGSGDCEVKTKYNSRTSFITVESVC